MNREQVLSGYAVAPGLAVGPARFYGLRNANGPHPWTSHTAHPFAHYPGPINPHTEVHRLDAAIAEVDQAIAAAEWELQVLDQPARVHALGAQRMILRDETLRQQVVTLIVEGGQPAHTAIVEAGEAYTAEHDSTTNDAPIQTAEIPDVVNQIWRSLMRESPFEQALTAPVIVLAYDLGPFELMSIPRDYLLGLALVTGGSNGHAGILARALGIPAIFGLDADTLTALPDETQLALDGYQGRMVIAPTEQTLTHFREGMASQAAHQAELHRERLLPSVTRDGVAVTLLANVASAAEARTAAEWGAMGVGSLRTEILFLKRPTLPTEDEQIALYQAVAAEIPDAPIVVRTLDIGGDKYLPAFPLPQENNPFLGWRGIRISLSHPDTLLLPQLRAMLRAGATANIRIVVPMIATLTEFRQVRALLRVAHDQLRAAGAPCNDHPQLGVLIEIPAAALMADAFAREADFVSIGTNDLTQYALACDRTSQRVAHLYQPLEPAVLHLIAATTTAAHRHGRTVSLCGEIAGAPEYTPLLLGLGIDELSCTPLALSRVRSAVRSTDMGAAQKLAQAALAATTSDEVQALLQAFAVPSKEH